MNEVEEMRDALDRAENNLTRFRWLITNPFKAWCALGRATQAPTPATAETVVKEIDDARKRG